MTQDVDRGRSAPVVVAPRVLLAHVVLAAAGGVRGVVVSGPAGDLEAGVPADVQVAAGPAGGYEVVLRMAAHPLPLGPLVRRVRAAVGEAVVAAGLEGELRRLDVVVHDVVESGVCA